MLCLVSATLGLTAASHSLMGKLAALPPIGDGGPLLAGEAAALSRGKQVKRKAEARVRLFALYGVGDSSTSLRRWVSSAPAWLEVRMLELPGHGYRAEEALPACAARLEAPVGGAALADQRASWISAMADDLVPHVESGQPYALYGFSFGALLTYELCRELARREVPPPLALFASGRGAPHAVTFSTARLAEVQRYDDERVLTYFAEAFGIDSDRIAPSVRQRAASLFRCGALLGAVHVGQPYDTDDAPNLWDDISVDVPHAAGVPALACPVVSISGSHDVCWPPRLVARWRDVVGSDGAYRHVELAETEHQALMNSKEAMAVVFDELGTMAISQVSESPGADGSGTGKAR